MSKPTGRFYGLSQTLVPAAPSRGQLGLLVVLTLVATGFELWLPLQTRLVIDGMDGAIHWQPVLLLATIVLATAASEYALTWFGGRLGQETNWRIRFRLIGHLLQLNQPEMDQLNSGELAARAVNDSQTVKTVLADDLVNLISGVVSLVAVLSVMLWMDWRLTLVMFFCLLLAAIAITPFALRMEPISKAIQKIEAELTAAFTEWFRNSKLIKANNAQQHFHQFSQSLLDESRRHAMGEVKVIAAIGPIANLALLTSLIVLLVFAAQWMAAGTMTLGTLTAFLLYLFGLVYPMISLGMFFGNLNAAAGAADRLHHFLQLPVESSLSPSILDGGFVAPTIRDLTWGPFQRFNLILPESGLVAIAGASGSGKSTLLHLLLGLYPDANRQVFLAETPLSDLELPNYRQHLAWVPQEPPLLSGTLRENLLLGQTFSDGDLIASLHQVKLAEWFEQLPQGLDTYMLESALPLSGGEKQRFAIARALLRQADMLMLDEPTSALDRKNSDSILALMKKLSAERLVIFTSHQGFALATADEVIQLDT